MGLVDLSRAAESSHSWMARLLLVCNISLLLLFLFTLCHGIYNVFFHTLRNYPGPTRWIAFPTFCHIASVRGVLDRGMKYLHEKHGNVVRFSSNQLSFITAEAWKDIYNRRDRQLPKFLRVRPGDASDIINANEADHARFRKALAPGFSERALAQQESLLMVYIDLLIEKLRDVSISGQKTDMAEWYTFTTFDMIGDLAFGAPFGGLQGSRLHDRVAMVAKAVKVRILHRTAEEYPLLSKTLVYLLAGKFEKARNENRAFVRNTVMRRINTAELDGRGDFVEAMQKHKGGPDDISVDELVSNAVILIIAGSETTVTLLAGVTYLLLKDPDCLRKVTEEVRGAFKKREEINFVNATSRLPDMLACLDEALRMYPPIPSGLERMVPPGPSVAISGNEVPPGTRVSVRRLAAYSSPLHFTSPKSYHPERWLSPTPIRFQDDNRAVLQPFSTGPRNYIGRNLAYNEMRLILARVLWSFDLELCPESENWLDQKTFIL